MEQGQEAQSWESIPEHAAATVAKWLQHTATPLPNSSDFLDGARADSNSNFTQKLLQLLASADDALLTAFGLRKLTQEIPPELPRKDKLALRAGSLTALGLPWAVRPLAQRWLRDRVSNLVCVTTLPHQNSGETVTQLRETLTALQQQHTPAQLELHGEPISGPGGSHQELRRLLALTETPEVTHLLADIGRLAPGDEWASEARIHRAVAALRELILTGAVHNTEITITASNYSDSILATTVAAKLLADPEVVAHRFGVTLYAEVPESFEQLTALTIHATARTAQGGAKLAIRICLRSTASAASINSLLTGHAFPVLPSRAEIEAAALQLVAQAQQLPCYEVTLCSDSPYLVAAALHRDSSAPLTIELRSGIMPELLLALATANIPTRVLLPTVANTEFRAALPLLLQLTAEAADPHSLIARSRMLEAEYLPAAELRYAELTHLHEICELAAAPPQTPRRTQDRSREWDPSERDSALFYRPALAAELRDTGGLTAAVLGLQQDRDTGEITVTKTVAPRQIPVVSESGFVAEPGTDVSRFTNRQWLRKQLSLAARAQAATAPVTLAQSGAAQHTTAPGEATTAAAPNGVEHSGQADRPLQLCDFTELPQRHANTLTARARVLRRIALTTVASRDIFTQLFARHTTLSAKQIDAQLNNLIDTARYLAQQAENLERVRGANFKPAGRVLIALDEPNYSAEALGAILAEYAAGNPVCLTAVAGAALCEQVLAQWLTAGLPGTAVACADFVTVCAASSFWQPVRALTCGSETLRRALQREYPNLAISSRSVQLGVATVTPSADYATAAQAIAESAFNGDDAGLRQVRAIVAVGSAFRAARFRQQLLDAVRAVPVGAAGVTDPLQHALAPLAAPPTPAQLAALTELRRGESWLLAPRQLDDAGLVWSPGIKLGVDPHSDFWEVAAHLPVLAVINCRSLQESLSLTNQLGSGAVAALFSWDAEEIIPWLDHAKAASLTVNRPTCQARVERLPGGTWSGANASIAPLTGGPHQLLALGSWELREGTASTTLHLRGLEPEIALLIETAQEWLDYAEFDRLRRAALADALTWRTQLGVVRDVSNLQVEHNVLRYWPVATHIRVAEDTPLEQIVRVLSAALLARAPFMVSTGMALPAQISDLLQRQGISVVLESDAVWLERTAIAGAQVAGVAASRIRIVGTAAARALLGRVDRGTAAVWAEPVTMAGPLELLAFLREQAVSIAAYRDGMVAQQSRLLEWLREIGR